MREERTEVLVVGAGPVGLLTALLLAKAGIEVRIIDRDGRTATRSYACALHPSTLQLLDQLGLAADLVKQGQRIQTIAFYDGKERRAEIELSPLNGNLPSLLILPQSALETALETRLRQEAGVAVDWNHRFDEVDIQEHKVTASIEKLGGTSVGYVVPHWEDVVQENMTIEAQFLLGADGQDSLVRQRLGLESAAHGAPELFAAYEFESDRPLAEELRVVLDDNTSNVLWPLASNHCRWTFQLVKTELPVDFPEKERRGPRFAEKEVDERIRDYVTRVAQKRAPWFVAGVKEIAWCTQVSFEHRLAKRFGQHRCWLAGDAAHQTGPIGAQSMNVGLAEAQSLATSVTRILRQEASMDSLESYEKERQAEWQGLLGLNGGLSANDRTNPWVRERRSRILSCLPGSGTHLAALARQLGLAAQIQPVAPVLTK
jgi:NADPH-dependent dioxygenase